MEIIVWIALAALTGLAAFQASTLKKLKKESANASALLNDLAFRHNDSTEFLANRIAGIHYDLLQRAERLAYFPDTAMEEALSRPGAKEVLIQRKMIRKKDKGPFDGTLAERARERKLSLIPILIALNDLEGEA